jgi:hypothetical protein
VVAGCLLAKTRVPSARAGVRRSRDDGGAGGTVGGGGGNGSAEGLFSRTSAQARMRPVTRSRRDAVEGTTRPRRRPTTAGRVEAAAVMPAGGWKSGVTSDLTRAVRLTIAVLIVASGLYNRSCDSLWGLVNREATMTGRVFGDMWIWFSL